MKHLTVELEAKIRNRIAFVEERMKDYMAHRKAVEVETGEFPKAGSNENEAAAWRRALNWVLSESGE
jgi:hypothetical protein